VDRLLIIILFLFSTYSFADFNAKVLRIIDGDTVHVKDNMANKIYKVRLLGIDAPEKNQNYGKQSASFLKEIIEEKYIKIISTPTKNNTYTVDRYNRVLGKIIFENQDINHLMIEKGMAWHYKKYKNNQPIEDQQSYNEAEISARKNNIGLWSTNNPMPPWSWRKINRKR